MSLVVTIDRIGEYDGKEATIGAWVTKLRSSGKLKFIILRDGTGIIQAVMSKSHVGEEIFSRFDKLALEASVKVTGTVKAESRAPGGYEIFLSDLEVVGESNEYPITPKDPGEEDHGEDFLLNRRHLWVRRQDQVNILKVRHSVIRAIRDYLDTRDFICFDSPIFTPNACEGTSTLFTVDYFGASAFLSQSGQLYQEAGAMAMNRVYCFGPAFRAEKSKTRRHLTEFWMVEPEVAWMDFEGVMDLMEDFTVEVVGRVIEERKEELKQLGRDISPLEKVQKPFPRIQYSDAVKQLIALGQPFEEGNDFGSPDETLLTKQYDRPIFVHRFPQEVKAFYMKRDPLDARWALGADLLAPEGYGEIIGGGQREDSYDVLVERIKHHELPMEPFEWYLDLRRYGSVPHSGFGIGVERTTTWICGIHHVRETIPFPRTIYRINP
ncbi:MAG: asparagine--tRNA ligase [bacterium]|nr:asparagine--tRNA ligase [bacterium]